MTCTSARVGARYTAFTAPACRLKAPSESMCLFAGRGKVSLVAIELSGCIGALSNPAHGTTQTRKAVVCRAGMCAPHHQPQDGQLHDSCLACSCRRADNLQAPWYCSIWRDTQASAVHQAGMAPPATMS